MKHITNFADAVKCCGNSYVLMNNVTDVAERFDDMNFFCYCAEIEHPDEETYTEIYQYFISDCSDSDVEYLHDRFGLDFAWCDCLSVWVLCVTHFGTAWDSVPVTDSFSENESQEA